MNIYMYMNEDNEECMWYIYIHIYLNYAIFKVPILVSTASDSGEVAYSMVSSHVLTVSDP